MVLPVVLVAVAVLGLMMWGAIWALNMAAARMVGDQHRLLQGIVETGEVPAAWRRAYEARMAWLKAVPTLDGRAVRVERRAQQHYLKQLDRLICYVETSTLVDGEQTRRVLLARLAGVRANWQALAPDILNDKRGP